MIVPNQITYCWIRISRIYTSRGENEEYNPFHSGVYYEKIDRMAKTTLS